MHWTNLAIRNLPRRVVAAALVVAAITLVASPHAFGQAPPPPPQGPPGPPVRFVVVLDAAHGGDDQGGSVNAKSGASEPEKAANLALSVRLRSLLSARGISTVTTRESDIALDANRRAEIANHASAQACLSLHASESGTGIHIFVSSLTPAEPTQFAPWKTAQTAWVTRSLGLAGVLNSALLHAGMIVTLGRTGLPGVDSMTCPTVAIEIAPERGSDHSETAAPGDPDYQARVAEALAAALLEWRSEAKQP